MPPLIAILVACVGGGVLSVAAAALTLKLHAAWVNKFVAFAVGALLGAVFLEVLPHALEAGKPAEEILTAVLGGVVLFFVLEKVVIWRHSHDHGHDGYDKGNLPAHETMGSSLGSVIGGLFGYWALAAIQAWVPYALALAAASMIYVAVADLIPGLQRRVHVAETMLQLLLLGSGIGVIAAVHHLLSH